MFCLALCGCGSRFVPVEGKILYKGQPLAGATVTFLSNPQGQIATGFTDANGQYRMDTLGTRGIIPGKYRVGISKVKTDLDLSKLTPEELGRMQASGKAPG